MSLRHVHLVFIGLAFVVAAGAGVWGIEAWRVRRDAGGLVVGVLAFGAAAALGTYAPWFVRKVWRRSS